MTRCARRGIARRGRRRARSRSSAGGGSLPIAVADAVERRGRRVVLFPVRGWADPAAVEQYPHYWLALAQAGRFLRHARAEGCRDVVFIGTAVRPPFRALRVDWVTLRLLPRVVRAVSRRRRSPAVGRRADVRGSRVSHRRRRTRWRRKS